jgi:hypothetical protein
MRALLLLLVACSSPSDPAVSPDGSTSPDGNSTSDDKRLYPLAVGRTWTYAVTSTYASCPGGMKEMRVLSASMREGRPTFEVRGFCGLTGHASIAMDRVEEYYDWGPTGWMRSLDEPVVDGHTWSTTNGSATFGMRYSDEGNDCWKVTQQVSYTTYWIYCRGKGLVRYEMIDLAGGTIKAELQ